MRTDELAGDRLRPAGAHILRVFDAADYLGAISDERGAAGRDVRAGATPRASSSGSRSSTASGRSAEVTLGLEDGLRFQATLDPATAALMALDGPGRLVRPSTSSPGTRSPRRARA